LSFGLELFAGKRGDFFVESQHDLRFLIVAISLISQVVYLIAGSGTQLSLERAERIIKCLLSELAWYEVPAHNVFVLVFNFVRLRVGMEL
jgi:hypothetical protein